VARALFAEGLPPEVEVLDLGANPAAIVDHLTGRAALVIVDAIALDGHAAGELIDCRWADVRCALFGSDARKSSTHELGLGDQLALAETLGLLPRVVRVVGLTVEHADVGRAPSDAVLRRLPTLVRHLRSVFPELASTR
jgi:hydrogenase maturation protease